jgi:hypothetical protein
MKKIAPAILKTGSYVISACVFLTGFKICPADKVSYSRQIAPILALHCNGCHSDESPSSGFRTGSYLGLIQGGAMGGDIVPAKPDASILVQLIEGIRGPEQRMPSGGRPLHPSEIQLIRSWIAQGAKYDRVPVPCYSLLSRAAFPTRATTLKIAFRIPVAGVVQLLLKEQAVEKIIFRREASVKPAPESMDAGAPGSWITWIIGRERGWPAAFDVQLRIRYTAEAPIGALLRIGDEHNPAALVNSLQASTCLTP